MKIKILFSLILCGVLQIANAADDAKPFLGNWALTIPGGGAGWLGIAETNGQLQAHILWGGGSVLPVTTANVSGDTLILTRVQTVDGKDASGKAIKINLVETITAQASGPELKLMDSRVDAAGHTNTANFTGKLTPPVPPAPDLSKVKFGAPITLFNGKDLSGWKLTDPNAVNGWSVI